MADTLAFEHRYTSGVIAWAPEDEPTDAEIEVVLDAFEKTAWAGLEPDRYAWTAVLHRERGGGAHVHVLAARCDLETGRSLNIAPPAGRGRRSAPRRVQPRARLEPSRRSGAGQGGAARPPRLHRGGAAAGRAPARILPRDLIRDYLLQRVEHATVRNRHEVVAALREASLEVPRQGKDYITALDPESGDRWRLKGELYAFDFERERLDRPAAEAAGDRTQGDRGVDRERASASTLSRFRVFDRLECSGGFFASPQPRNSRSEIESAHRHAMPRSEPIPSRYPTISIRKYTPALCPAAALLRIELAAHLLRELVETVLFQQLVQSSVERVAQRPNPVGRHEQLLLPPLALLPYRLRRPRWQRTQLTCAGAPDRTFSTDC